MAKKASGAIKTGDKVVCTAGRRAGQEAEVTKVVDKNFLMVKTGKGKERKISIRHIEPL